MLLLSLDPKDSGDSGLIWCSTTLTNLWSIEKKKKENPEGDEEDDSEREVEMERSQGWGRRGSLKMDLVVWVTEDGDGDGDGNDGGGGGIGWLWWSGLGQSLVNWVVWFQVKRFSDLEWAERTVWSWLGSSGQGRKQSSLTVWICLCVIFQTVWGGFVSGILFLLDHLGSVDRLICGNEKSYEDWWWWMVMMLLDVLECLSDFPAGSF